MAAAFLACMLVSSYAQSEDPYLWDFGRVRPAQVLTHTFMLKNETGQPLTIKDISTSCGCTAFRATKTLLAPGESTAIEVTFNTKGYSGHTSQFVYVYTDALNNSVIKFTVTATITMEVQ